MNLTAWLFTALFAANLAAAGQSAPSRPGSAATVQGAAGNGSLGATLGRLDAASANFHSTQADFHKELFNALVKDTTPQEGKVYFLRSGKSAEMGIRIVGPGARTVLYKDGTLKDYNPGIKCFDTINPGNQARTETFLTLGFGGSGRDLEKAWTITDLGPDVVAGKKLEKLSLIPKEQSVRTNVSRVTLWMDLERGIALKQVLLAPSGDITTATYSNIRYNEKVDVKGFEISGKPCGK